MNLIKGSATIIDQGIVSGSRFFIILILARYVTPAEYGGFVMAYGVLMMTYYIQTSYILMPMSVLGPSLEKNEQRDYYGSLTKIQILLALLTMLFLLSTSDLWSYLFREPGLSQIMISMAFASFSMQMQEFVRKLFFNSFEMKRVILNDSLCSLGQLVGISIFIYSGKINAVNVFWLMTLFSSFAAFLGYCQCHGRLNLRAKDIKKTSEIQFSHGKWLLASMTTQWIAGQMYIYISALLLNMSAAGILGACRNLFGVINVAFTGIKNFVLPYAARQFSLHGSSFLKVLLRNIYILGGLVVIPYGLVVSLFSSNILQFLYKGKYDGFEYVVILFAVHAVISFYVFPPNTGLLVIRKPKGIFTSNLVSSTISLVIVLPFIYLGGLVGALLSMIITQLILVIVITKIYHSEFVGIAIRRPYEN